MEWGDQVSKHTPGPLEVRSLEGVWSVFEAKTLTLTASCPDGTPSRPSGIRETSAEEALANAWLYAAAPDMLPLCKEALELLGPDEEIPELDHDCGAEPQMCDDRCVAAFETWSRNDQRARLRAAIAKAEGRA